MQPMLPAVVGFSGHIYRFGMELPTKQLLHPTHFCKALYRAERERIRGMYSIVSKLIAHSSTYV